MRLKLPSIFALALAAACASPLTWANDYAEVQRLLKAGQLAQATAKAEAYIQAKPKDPQMRFLLSTVQSAAGQEAQAVATLRALVTDYPELAEPHNNLAVLYAARGDYSLARSELETAISLNPDYTTAYENLGDVYARLANQQYTHAARTGGNAPRLNAKQRGLSQVLGTGTPATPASTTAPAAAAPTSVNLKR